MWKRIMRKREVQRNYLGAAQNDANPIEKGAGHGDIG